MNTGNKILVSLLVIFMVLNLGYLDYMAVFSPESSPLPQRKSMPERPTESFPQVMVID